MSPAEGAVSSVLGADVSGFPSCPGAEASVVKHGDFNDSEASLDGVGEQQPSRTVDLLILLLDEPGDLLQHLLVVSLHTEEGDVGGDTGETSLQVRPPAELLCLSVQVIQTAYGLLKLSLVHPGLELGGDSGVEPADGP